MKNFKLLTLLFIAFLGITITSCGDDDDNNNDNSPAINSFTYEGATHSLSKGLLSDFGDNGNGSYDFDILLLSDDIIIDADNGLSGNGNLIYLDLNSDSMVGLTDGTYEFAVERDAFTIVDGTVAVNSDIEDYYYSGAYDLLTAGNVMLSISGDNYDIDFNLTNASGESVIGNYQGTLVDY